MNKREVGRLGEEIALKYLENKGLSIIERNYFTKYGEIDLIGIENQTIIFIEVKLRNNEIFGLPWEGINSKKLKKIKNSANFFLQKKGFLNFDCRFDVVTLIYDKRVECYKVNWFKNQYFD